jgi:hypothetical protein
VDVFFNRKEKSPIGKWRIRKKMTSTYWKEVSSTIFLRGISKYIFKCKEEISSTHLELPSDG